ncbi:hypothetical protein, partial [Kingella kingae]|uniref:hypothetical protein n=1 Tax=Kingella kingae TaxID=504 RepID=UPI001E406940
ISGSLRNKNPTNTDQQSAAHVRVGNTCLKKIQNHERVKDFRTTRRHRLGARVQTVLLCLNQTAHNCAATGRQYCLKILFY